MRISYNHFSKTYNSYRNRIARSTQQDAKTLSETCFNDSFKSHITVFQCSVDHSTTKETKEIRTLHITFIMCSELGRLLYIFPIKPYYSRTGSSTVTEASTDDDKTPVVSRDSSRAQDFQDKARQMFSTLTPRNDHPLTSYGTRPKYSWEVQKSFDSGYCEGKSSGAIGQKYQTPIQRLGQGCHSTSHV